MVASRRARRASWPGRKVVSLRRPHASARSPSRVQKEVSRRALADSRVVGRVGGDVIWSPHIGLLVSLLLPRLPAVLSQALH